MIDAPRRMLLARSPNTVPDDRCNSGLAADLGCARALQPSKLACHRVNFGHRTVRTRVRQTPLISRNGRSIGRDHFVDVNEMVAVTPAVAFLQGSVSYRTRAVDAVSVVAARCRYRVRRARSAAGRHLPPLEVKRDAG